MAEEFKKIYVFVARNLDLPNGQNLTVTCGRMSSYKGHAIAKLCTVVPAPEVVFCEMITLQVPSSSDFKEVEKFLNDLGMSHSFYYDEDRLFNGELLASIVVHPLSKKDAAKLHRYRPWKCACNGGT